MSKLSPRDLQMCVAGAFALSGFYGLYWLPFYLFTSPPNVGEIFVHIITALALPLGIGITLDSARAILLTRIYLWLDVICGCIVIPLYWVFTPSHALHMLWRIGPDFALSIILLVLITRSVSWKPIPEPTP